MSNCRTLRFVYLTFYLRYNGRMENTDLDETMPTPLNHEQENVEPTGQPDAGNESHTPVVGTGKTKRSPSWRVWTALGIVALVLIAATSAFGGYRAGIDLRTSAESTQNAYQIQEQYELGLQDMEAGSYNLARQRFEYVIQLNPSYPGVTEKLADVLLELNTTATPTIVPTPTKTPTPDLRGVEELFAQAQQHLANNDWTAAIDTLLALRKADLNYQAVWVDDMLYVSLRNRGKDKILKDGNLEGGIYDLSLAERFGLLDVDARGYLTWARLYITGASFWEIDWGEAVYYFGQVAPAMPNLRDGSGWTATERYRLALIGYAGFLADNKQWCDAQETYELALSYGTDPDVEVTLEFVTQKCSPPAEEQPTPPETLTVTPTTAPPPEDVTPTTVPPPVDVTPTLTATTPVEEAPTPTEAPVLTETSTLEPSPSPNP